MSDKDLKNCIGRHTLGDIKQRAPNKVFNTSLFGSICHINALLNFIIKVQLLPIVGDCKYGMRTLGDFKYRVLITDIRLTTY